MSPSVVGAPRVKRTAVHRQRPGLGAEVAGKEPQERLHLVRRSLPVIGREGEEGQRADTQIGRSLHRAADRVSAPQVLAVPIAGG